MHGFVGARRLLGTLDITVEASPKLETIDRNGLPVRVGTVVRVLSIPDDIFADLTKQEATELRTMVGEAFPVDDIDEWGCARVTKWWHMGNGEHRAHDLMLAPNEMEVAQSGA